MTLLQIMPDDAPDTVLFRTRDEEAIAQALRERSISFTRWPSRVQVTPRTSSEELLHAYRAEIGELCADQGLRLVDVARLHPEDGPAWQERAAKARSMFLDEHRHTEDEVRFFAHGTGCFYLHLDDRVYAVVCEAGDLLSVPAGTRHWFDMGPVPDFCAIRFFENEDGWVGDFTREPIAEGFPHLDALLGER
ncbi:1,2-dihydroxy-3-keto-5-methylthiopentene dioxygenase [Streptomyces sp. NBC_00525]|uniref:1,2-dihydroxy-3-keto-5-methylthiopentene dioxygenase n=1 Tax=Streptomyces sp. NBC_00525 TaxID=2903660 RepID=UPI002E80A71A|nr:cupin [Streptomyces sp. NBC_00525]WUC97275.1 cupin [Streptomyces sp. NBC_00525]